MPLTLETAPADTPLIAHLVTGEALHPDVVGRLFKGIFARSADQLAPTYPNAAADLRRASAHWLRHTFANDGLDAGADIRDMQELFGHASLGTTTLYTKADAVRQFQSVETLFNAALDSADPPAIAAVPVAPSPATGSATPGANAVQRSFCHTGPVVSTQKPFGVGACGRAILSAWLAIGEQSLNDADERTCSATMQRSFESVLIAFARLAMGNRTSRSPEGCHEGHSGGPRFTVRLMPTYFKRYD
ncbi:MULTISPECIES: tyrosine-type recombinase/integrase [unclassified Burkholderia]|uniref:tyrosine-type recombinase/integrase n=1 Tax=unclassified Burkholderia TaxID=2613784 RepID=UPI002686BC9C|nr:MULTISPECIES: tyrosine-type recombinase/integrase [unclassified Burkholderia]